ncbi:YoaK family protein [Streptomyces sp. NPDC001177]
MTTEPPAPSPDASDPEARGMRLRAVLLVLTAVSGLIDAVSFLSLGQVFTANMTGNVVILGFAAAGAPGFSVAHTVTSLMAFLAGATAGGRIAARFRGGSRRTWTRVALAMEAVLVGSAAVVAFARPGTTGTAYTIIALSAFAIGLRNATVRKLSVPDLTTTVLTMTLTGLVAESPLGSNTERRARRRISAVLSLTVGGALGAWLVLHQSLGIPLLLAALTSGVLAVVASGRE